MAWTGLVVGGGRCLIVGGWWVVGFGWVLAPPSVKDHYRRHSTGQQAPEELPHVPAGGTRIEDPFEGQEFGDMGGGAKIEGGGLHYLAYLS